MLADEVLVDLLTVGNVKDEVGAFTIHEVNVKKFGPLVFVE